MSVTLDLSRVSGLDVLVYWQEYGQGFPEDSPYRDLGELVAWWGREDAAHSTVDRMIVAWLTVRQAGVGVGLAAFVANLPALPDVDDDEAPSGAGFDAPEQMVEAG